MFEDPHTSVQPALAAIVAPKQKRDADRTRLNILKAATKQIAKDGLSGASIDSIAEQMRTSKRMIYYYFGSKDGLYQAVLSKAYGEMRAFEAALHLEALEPETALRRLIHSTFEYNETHPDYVRLIMIENVHRAEHLGQSVSIQNTPAIEVLSGILNRGYENGVFRRRIEPVYLHMMITALCFFPMSNQHTFATLFGQEITSPEARAKQKGMFSDLVLTFLRQS